MRHTAALAPAAGDAHTFAHARTKQWTPRTRSAGLPRTHTTGAGVLTALTEYPRTVARALRRPTPACVAGAGVASPGADVGADVGGRSACAPQRIAATHAVADPTASAVETAAAAADAVQPLGAAAPGRTDRVASASPTDSPTGVGCGGRCAS